MTAPTKNGNGRVYVTWSNLIAGLGVTVAVLGGLNTFVWAQHNAHPHVGTVTDEEMGQFEKRIEAEFRSIRSRLDEIKRAIERK